MSKNPAATPTPPTILVIDDEPDLRTLYELTLLRAGYAVEAAGTLVEARERLERRRYDAVISDMRLPDGTGLEVLQWLRAERRPERCIVITAYGSAENAVEALKAGAFDYLAKPVEPKQFRAAVAAAVQAAGDSPAPHATAPAGPAEAVDAQPAPTPAPSAPSVPDDPAVPALAPLIGDSAAMRAVKHRIAKVARSMAPVLVRGESGTGKELVARALHAASHRAAGPLVAVNCGAIPENLLEAEFFGARKGSYTGAMQDREGFFQAARGGTLFLDEIGELPLAMQAKLLRAIQERSVRALGATQEEAVDVRIVSATHRDLAADVREGRFRQDLFYRLNVIEIVVPPLRDRREDLPALVAALLARITHDTGLAPPRLSPGALERLACLPLPGNVRELENLLHRAVALSEGGVLELEDEAADGAAQPPPASAQDGTLLAAPAPCDPPALPHDLPGYLDAREREILVQALRDNRFNRTATAARLGISLRQIRYRIARLQIAAPQDESGDDTAA